jgi:hypothetical protein
MMTNKKYYKNWNIKGIAESVIEEIKEDGEELDNVLDYYLQRTYWSIYSREPKDAVIVVELVRQHIEELEARL